MVPSGLIAEVAPQQEADTRRRFTEASPFPHVIIDNFFTESFFSRLLKDFPEAGTPDYIDFCRADGGAIGTDYANGTVSTFPPAFAELDRLVASDEFRSYITRLTGIDGLEYDGAYFGGGIRESRSGTFLPPHLDFNYHPVTHSHRRMNLLFYLNEDWQAEWGGNLQVHRDPNVFNKNDSLVHSYLPKRNRCLIFETSETSWHGFDRLVLPPEKSRRAFTIYYYTRSRPNAESIQLHNTEYVEPPLPEHFRAGHVLTDADVALLHEYIQRRDGRIRMLYDLRKEMDARMRNFKVYVLRAAARRALAPFRRLLGR